MYWFASLRISPHQQDVRCFTQGIECDEALRERNARPATFKWHELDDRLLQHFSQSCLLVCQPTLKGLQVHIEVGWQFAAPLFNAWLSSF